MNGCSLADLHATVKITTTAEEHSNAVFLPKVEGEEPLYIGMFHTGAYQDSISGYGGIQHCLIPAPKACSDRY